MLTQTTVIDRISIAPSGVVEIELGLAIESDGVEIARAKHGTAFEPGDDAAQRLAQVNAHLATMGREALPAKDVSRIAAVASAVHTKEVVDEFRARLTALEVARAR